MQNSYEKERLGKSLEKNILRLRTVLGNSMDFNAVRISINGVTCAVLTIEGMISTDAMSELVFRPLMSLEGGSCTTPDEIMNFVSGKSLMAADRNVCYTLGTLTDLLFSGFAAIMVDGINTAVAFGIQGYATKSISTPTMENDLLASQEAFAEVVRTNISLIRRRIKHPSLRFEMLKSGKISNTDVCIVYIEGKADSRMLSEVRKRINSIGLDSILGPGFVQPFLEKRSENLLFTEIGYTERPDMLSVNLIQGRIGILVDGTPFALICPYIFPQYFENIDDYAAKTYFAAFVKTIRYLSFILAVAFPGMYVAAVNFNPEMLNLKLLLSLAAGERSTMLSLFCELIIVMLLLEILREASIRLPNSIGTAISIAGGLIIGETAVKSGIISSPLLIVVGITATASFVLPTLNQQVSVLRLAFIFAGGFAGFFGISVCAVMTIANICSQSFVGIPFTSPLSPFRKNRIMNIIGRKNFGKLEKESPTIKDLA